MASAYQSGLLETFLNGVSILPVTAKYQMASVHTQDWTVDWPASIRMTGFEKTNQSVFFHERQNRQISISFERVVQGPKKVENHWYRLKHVCH